MKDYNNMEKENPEKLKTIYRKVEELNEKSDTKDYGPEFSKIVDFIELDNQIIRDGIEWLLNRGYFYEPKPGYIKTMDADVAKIGE